MAAAIVKEMPRDRTGTKALAAGQQTTSTIVLPDVVVQGRPAASILDVLPTRLVPPSYSFLQQSVVSVVAQENRLRVVAHISEQIDHYLLSDAVNLERFVEDELVSDCAKPLRNK